MPWIVNSQPVPEDLIQQESAQIARDPRWKNIADEGERAKRLRAAAEHAAQDKMLISQAAARDLRPVDPGLVAQQVARIKKNGSCRSAFDDTSVRQVVEHSVRVERLTREMVESAPKPTAEEVEAFHRTNRENFRMPEMFHAAHIVKHVNEEQSEEQAEAGIQAALADLERGVPFAEAAEIHSDCKGNGGDLGQFPPGHMVEEFEAAISALQPGERTGIFTTPFGFHIAELRAKAPGAISARRCGDAFQGRYPVGSLMPPDPPSPCCVPSKRRLAQLVTPIKASFERPRAVAGSLEDMVRLEGGRFRMGSESPEAFACDGEDPMRQVTLAGFHISRYAVSNAH